MTGNQLCAAFPGILDSKNEASAIMQRDTKSRLESGQANYVKGPAAMRPLTQTCRTAVWFDGKINVLDGNTRIAWENICPEDRFEEVTLDIYEPRTEEEFLALYVSADNPLSVKTGNHSMQSIFKMAGINQLLNSKSMRLGSNIVSAMNHAFNWPKGLKKRAQYIEANKATVFFADGVLELLQEGTQGIAVHQRKEIFGAGELSGVLAFHKKLGTAENFDKVALTIQREIQTYFLNRLKLNTIKPKHNDLFFRYEITAQGSRSGESNIKLRGEAFSELLTEMLIEINEAAKLAEKEAAKKALRKINYELKIFKRDRKAA